MATSKHAKGSRGRTRVTRAIHYLLFLAATAIKVPLIMALYAAIVFAAFAFGIGLFDSIRAGHDIASVWPQLHQMAAYVPGGLTLAPFAIVAVAWVTIRLLDRAVDSLRPR